MLAGADGTHASEKPALWRAAITAWIGFALPVSVARRRATKPPGPVGAATAESRTRAVGRNWLLILHMALHAPRLKGLGGALHHIA